MVKHDQRYVRIKRSRREDKQKQKSHRDNCKRLRRETKMAAN